MSMKYADFTGKNCCVRRTMTGVNAAFICIFLSLFVSPVGAIEVEALYQGTVSVESRQDARERNRAFGNALRQVLLKVTGNSAIFSNTGIRRALANADDYVDTWSYRTVSFDKTAAELPVSEDSNNIELDVSFFEPQIQALLEESAIPFWPENRPYTLVWAVVENELGDRQLAGDGVGESEEVQRIMEGEADRRGLPLLFPIMDFEDRQAISVDRIWELDEESLALASRRYQSESVLAMRIFRTIGGEVVAKSSYLFRDQVFTRDAFEEPLTDFIGQSVDMAAYELAGYYGILLSGTQSRMEVNLTVNGIRSVEDYAGLLGYVNELTDVSEYQVASVNNETIQLRLSTGGQIRQLVETIALNRSLSPLGDLIRENNQVFMNYQWNR